MFLKQRLKAALSVSLGSLVTGYEVTWVGGAALAVHGRSEINH